MIKTNPDQEHCDPKKLDSYSMKNETLKRFMNVNENTTITSTIDPEDRSNVLLLYKLLV